MKLVVWILLWILTASCVWLFIDLNIYYWSHLDMTNQRVFVNNWAEYLLFTILVIATKIGWELYSESKL